MSVALRAEWLKLRRARTPRAVLLVVGLAVPIMTVGMILADRSGQAGGAVGGKLEAFLSDGSVVGQLGLAAQILTLIVLLGGGFLSAWICGREFADATVGGLFALPVSRGRIAAAKLLLAWACTSLAAVLATALTVVGVLVLNDGALDDAVVGRSVVLLVAGLFMAMLSVCFGWVATLARGYLVAVAVLIGTVAVAQLVAAFGGGAWFPFSAVALWAGAGGPVAAAAVSPVQLVAVPMVAALAALLTTRRWDTLQLG